MFSSKQEQDVNEPETLSLRCNIQSIMQTTTTKGNTRIQNSSVTYNISSLN